MILEAVKDEEFLSSMPLSFNNISEGFEKYLNGILEVEEVVAKEQGEERIIEFLEELLEVNGEENSYVDFYYERLEEEDKNRLKKLLGEEDRLLLEDIEKELKGDGIYFRLTKYVLPFMARLCTREILFSTFYFTKMPCTIWGNYNLRFPCFFNKEEEMEFYQEVSSKHMLRIV